VISLEETPGGERLTWRNGDVTLIPPDDNPHLIRSRDEALRRADFAATDPGQFEPTDFSGYVWNIYHVPRTPGAELPTLGSAIPEAFNRTIRLVRQSSEARVSVHGEVFSPFTHFMELFGYEEALIGLMTDPGKAHAVLERLTAVCVAWAAAQAQQGVDAVLISSAFAGGSFISRERYREFVVPYEARVVDAIHRAGVPAYTHTCGKIGDRLELMMETGTRGIDTLDPHPLGNVDLADAKQRIGSQMFIKGNLNAVELLAAQTVEEIREPVLDRLRAGKPGGGYILSTACSVAPRVEPWKLEMLTPLAEEFGRYS
jgi:uroporphyrinogen-III decarboxylase